MQLEPGRCYHLYNRSNAGEVVFKSPDNYLYFLQKYSHYLEPYIATLAYCLMPTHFHFCVRQKSEDTAATQNAVGLWLSSYTKALNKRHNRHGSLFQHHTKALSVTNEHYLLTLLTYIHQNPVRAGLAHTVKDWPYSSYPDLAGYRNGTLPDREFVKAYFPRVEDFRVYSQQPIREIDASYWIG